MFRSLEILESLGLVKVIRSRGGKHSECQLFDERELALRLGAVYNRKSLSFSLPPEVAERLKADVKSIRAKQQGKTHVTTIDRATDERKSPDALVPQRNASVAPEKRQRPTRETQTGTHLIREERRIEEGPNPTLTPSDSGEAQKDKNPSDDDPEGLLKWARAKFTGVMKDMGNHILNTNRPPAPHLTNGAADWEEFGFNSLAVEAATWQGGALALTFSASDPEAARRGLEKYHRKFNASLRTWYECEVKMVW